MPAERILSDPARHSLDRRLLHVGIGVIEALIGLGLLGVVISYLPTVYNAYLDREIAVARLGLASELRRIAHRSDGVPAYRTG